MITPLDLLGRFGDRLSVGARREIENRSPVPLSRRRQDWRVAGRTGGDYLAHMETYGSDAVVFPIVERLASSTAEAEWNIFRKSASGREEDRKPVLGGHAALDLLEQPNRHMDRMELMEAGQQHMDLTGEINIVIGKVDGIAYPVDLWPIRPDRLTPVPDPYEYLAGWVYTGPDGERVPLKNDELLRRKRPSPIDPYRGMGPIQALMRDLDAQRYGREWQAAFFANSAQPGGIIEVDRHLSDDEFDEMNDRWRESHQGISKAHRVAIIEHGAKWISNQFSLKDLQFAELDTVGRDKTLTAFGFPKSMLGIVEDVNRANAEAGEYLFARWLTVPRLVRWRGMFNTRLLKLYGETTPKRFELDFVSPLPENSEVAMRELEVKSTAAVELIGGGMDAAKVLELLDWPDLGYTAPPPPAPALPSPGAPGEEEEETLDPDAQYSFGEHGPEVLPEFVNAMRWAVKGEEDGNACDPCKKNHGKLYRNRSSAYADYPGGKGYIKCVGAQYGNDCRCTVVKRRVKE